MPMTDLPCFQAAWFSMRPEKSKAFFQVFVGIAVALQTELRRILPSEYLSKLDRFEDPHLVNPLLVYAASRPYRARTRTEISYDPLNPELMNSFYYSVRIELPNILANAYRRLRDAGLDKIARKYRPGRSPEIIAALRRHKLEKRRLHQLLLLEARMLNSLFAFAGSSEFNAPRRDRIARDCGKFFLRELRRSYGKFDLTSFAQQIIDAITPALDERVAPVSAECPLER